MYYWVCLTCLINSMYIREEVKKTLLGAFLQVHFSCWFFFFFFALRHSNLCWVSACLMINSTRHKSLVLLKAQWWVCSILLGVWFIVWYHWQNNLHWKVRAGSTSTNHSARKSMAVSGSMHVTELPGAGTCYLGTAGSGGTCSWKPSFSLTLVLKLYRLLLFWVNRWETSTCFIVTSPPKPLMCSWTLYMTVSGGGNYSGYRWFFRSEHTALVLVLQKFAFAACMTNVRIFRKVIQCFRWEL